MSGNSCECLQLLETDIQIICHALRRLVHRETAAQGRILSCRTHRAVSAAADAVLLTSRGHHRRRGHRDRVRSHGQRLGKIRGHPQASGNNQGNVRACRVQIFSCPIQSVNRRHAGGVPHNSRRGPGCSAPPVNGHEIRFREDTVLQIPLDMSRRDLDADGPPVASRPQAAYQIPQVFSGGNLRESGGADHILPQRLVADLRNLRRHFLPRQMTAHPRLGPLTDLDLHSVGSSQIFICHTVFVRNILKDIPVGCVPLLRQNTSLAAAHGRCRP